MQQERTHPVLVAFLRGKALNHKVEADVRTLIIAQAAAETDLAGAPFQPSLTPRDAQGERTRVSDESSRSDLQRSDIEALLGRDYIGLRTLIFRRTGDLQVAADLLNDAICTALEKYRAGQIEKPEQICGYIFQVAMNHLRNYRRSIGDRPERRADPQRIDSLPTETGDDLDIDDRTVDKVIRIMRSMDSARDRTILVRFYLDEDDKESICRDMRLTPVQFDNVLHRARRRLRDLLEAQGLKGSDVFSWFLL